jgi:hypothetical protein
VGSVIPRVANAYASAAAFDAMAASLLRRCLAKGRGIDLSAIAAYWLRPTQTVTVQLPIGPQERHLVRAVEFSLHEGTMQVSTKNPDTVSTISTGG